MNKNLKSALTGRLLHTAAWLLLTLCFSINAAAQSRTVSGTVTDEAGDPMIGVSVNIPGQNVGVSTDIDGNYKISLPAGTDRLQFAYVGYTTRTLDVKGNTLDVQLDPASEVLQEMVVIGYGTQKKEDLTGSIASVGEKDFNQGVISSPEELINGKIAGVQIPNSGGSPNSGSTIRVRGGASLNASNDPLIVLDGVPMEVGGGITGSGNFLSMINPNDIESMTILKDASSTAIYGSRASNGVIIITTKKGGGDRVKVSFSTTNSLSNAARHTPMLSTADFREAVKATGNQDYINAMGNADTNWNDAIFRTGFGTDNNISIGGRATDWLPYRVSLGAMYQEGILKRDNVARYTANLNLTPTFFGDKLRVNLSGKGSYSRNRFSNTGAIWNALAYDPTQNIYGNYDENGQPLLYTDGSLLMGGYHEVIDKNGIPGQGAIANPLAMVELPDNTADVYRFIGNVDLDYRLHPLPELRFHVTGGMDWASGKSRYLLTKNSFSGFNDGGLQNEQGPQKNINKLLTVYANYNKEFEAINSTVDATIGYDYQYWKSSCPEYNTYNEAGDYRYTTAAWDERHTLLSYYGRLNFSYDSRYLLTATFRRDGSSRFASAHRWGTFPAVALAWRVAGE
ncbi:MAG: SusC/RagA family TonB-linked outer membrane protein, partial [Muribaculaceae bacterium]|nr:SusC/RagA family TonB-linked outer membrane protein [Muribaculaceae bacterium]